MIHELRTYTFHPGKQPEYLKFAEEIGRPIRGNDYGLNQGYWTSEIGTLNQIWHLWSYESLDAREALRQKLAKNDAWKTNMLRKSVASFRSRKLAFLARSLTSSRQRRPVTFTNSVTINA